MDRETLYKQWQDPTGDTALGLNRIKTHKGPSQAEIEVGIKHLKELRATHQINHVLYRDSVDLLRSALYKIQKGGCK